MGLSSWLSDVIPNELKGSLGTVAAVAGAAYLGYQYAPKMYSAAKGFIGQSEKMLQMGEYGKPIYQKATGLYGWIDKTADKYPRAAKFVKGFGKQVAGQAFKDESEAEARARYAEQSRLLAQRMRTKAYNIPSVGSPMNVGTFQSTRAPQVPGFKNPRVNESLNLMAYFMQDLQDNGRIDSSALYAESTRGTTIKLPKTMKMSI